MPGTLLLDDWRQSVEDRLNEHIKGLQQSTQSALQAVSQPVQQVDPQAIASRLQSHVEDLIGQSQQALQPIGQGIQQAAGNALQPLGGDTRDQVAQRLQQHVASLVAQPDQGALQTLSQPQVQPVAAGADVLGAPPSADVLGSPSRQAPTGDMPNVQVDASSPEAFIRSIAPAAQWVQQHTGIPAEAMIGMAANETGYGKAAPGNNLFGIKGDGPAGATTSPTWEDYGNGPVTITDKFRRYNNATESFQDFVQFLRDNSRYRNVMNLVDQGKATVGGFVQGLKDAGYMTDPNYVGKIQSIVDRYQPSIDQARSAGPAQVTTAQARAADLGYKDVSQFGDPQLTNSEAYAACGPAAAVRFAEKFGRNPSLKEALDLAKEVGWTAQQGMAGISSQQSLMTKLGIPTKLVQGAQWDQFAKEAQSGNPVTISTGSHYFFADGYDPQSGAFHVGRSGTDLRGGKEWMTSAEIVAAATRLGGGEVQGALFADNPGVPTKSQAGTAPTSSTQSDVVRAPGAAVRPVLYAGANQPADQTMAQTSGPTPIQTVQDVLGDLKNAAGGTLGAVGETIGGAASALGTTASGAAQGAQRVLNLDEDAGRRQREALAALEANPAAQKRAADIAGSFRPLEPDQVGPREVLGTAGQAILGGVPVGQVRSPEQIRAGQKAATEPITAPLSEALGQVKIPGTNEPVPVLQGLSTMLVEQAFAAPYMIPGALGASTLGGIGARIMGELAPNAPAILTRLGTGAINGGLQNAILAAGEKDADAQSVGTAFLVGAGLGGAMDVGGGVAVDIGRAIVRRMPDIQPVLEQALRSRQRGEVTVDAALAGAPGAVERARGFRAPEAGVADNEAAVGGRPSRTGPLADVSAGGTAAVPFRQAGETWKDATLRNLRGTGLAPADEVGNAMLGRGPVDSPEYLQGVVQFLGEQRQKIMAGELTPRDVIKAYLATMSSIRARALEEPVAAARARGAGFEIGRGAVSTIEGRPMVRPEDAFASWMLSSEGKASLDALERGDLTPAQVGGVIDRFRGAADRGGMGTGQPMMDPAMLTGRPGPNEFNLSNIADLTDRLNAAGRAGNVDEALRLAGRMKGVGTAKEGFVAHLLGLGDSPTVDTNELKIWLERASPELRDRVEKAFGTKGSPAAVEMRDQLMQRFNELRAQGYGTDIPPEAFQHVMHHWLFDRKLGAETTHAELYRAQQRAQASAPFATNLAGAALGGYAGNLATPQDAPLEERLRNIGVGATTGLLGTRAITGSGGARLAEALAGRGERGGFRAPGGERPTLEDQLLQARARTPEGGAAPPPPPREPTRLSDVHSNPHTLREAGPDATPLTDDELSAHMDRLQEREAAVQSRLEAVDEQLRNPNAKPERPPWAAGWTNNDLVQVARENGVSAYEPNWWEKAGLETGSGEVQRLSQSGIRGPVGGGREPSLGELRAEKNRLVQEQQDLQAAGEQLTTAPAGARFAAPSDASARDLPFDVGTEEGAPHGPYAVEGNGSSGVLADDIVTRNGTSKRPSGLNTLWSEPGQVAARGEGVTGRGVADAEAAGVAPPSEATLRAMPNLDALLSEEVPPEIRLQIQKAVEDNPELFAAYQQGRISHDSLRDDLARKVGMSTKDWLKTPVGKGFSTPELVALQAAAVDAQHSVMDMATEIMAREGGVDALTPEEVAFSLSNLLDTASLLHVASGSRSTQGRSLNALKIRMDRELARGIAGANERTAARRTADQAKRGALRATQLLNKARDLDAEGRQAVNRAREAGVPKNILDQIDEAYKQLDAYQAMTLHEKADDFAKLAEARAAAAAKRKAAVREAPEELLSALRQELKAERDNFAKRKDTWENMAFWDSKSEEKALDRGTAFAGGRYLELQRKAANDAAKLANREAELAWKRASQLESKRSERAKALLERIGGEAPSRELLKAFVQAMASPDPMVAAKFMKGLQPHRTGFAGFVDMVRNANVMRLAGMLSATATHIVNMGGNAIGATLEVPTHGLTIAIDKARAAATGGERQAYGAELGPMIRGWGRVQGGEGRGLGFLASLPDVVQVLQTGISPAEVADLSKIRPGFRSSDLPVVGFGLGKIPGRTAERVIDPAIEMPLRLLQAEDAMFRGGAFGMHAERVATRQAIRDGFTGAERTARANNIIANLEDYPELYKEAADSAARMIYQERRTAPGMSGVRLSGTPGEATEAAVSQVLPFRKTPINVTAQGLGLSPLGVAGVLEAVGSRGAIEARVRTGELPASRLGQQTLLAEQRAARAIIGTGILGAFYMLGTQRDDQGKPKGTLTAMYDENEASTYPQGWRAWSMRTENPANGEIVYTPFQNFGAAGVPMAMAAIAADAERRGKKFWSDDKEMGRAIAGVGRYALDTPFLQGLSDTVDLFHDPGRAGTKFIEGLVSSYGPYSGMGRQVQRAYGVASRNPREGWNMLLDALEADYPGLSGNVPEATTALGEPRTPGATGFGSIVGRYDIERDEPTLKALRENDVNVPAAPKSVSLGGGYGIELTEAEQDTLKRARGAAIRQSVEQTIGNPRFQQADLASRNLNLRMVVSAAASKANDDFLRRMSRDEIRQRQKVMREPEPSPLGAG